MAFPNHHQTYFVSCLPGWVFLHFRVYARLCVCVFCICVYVSMRVCVCVLVLVIVFVFVCGRRPDTGRLRLDQQRDVHLLCSPCLVGSALCLKEGAPQKSRCSHAMRKPGNPELAFQLPGGNLPGFPGLESPVIHAFPVPSWVSCPVHSILCASSFGHFRPKPHARQVDESMFVAPFRAKEKSVNARRGEGRKRRGGRKSVRKGGKSWRGKSKEYETWRIPAVSLDVLASRIAFRLLVIGVIFGCLGET